MIVTNGNKKDTMNVMLKSNCLQKRHLVGCKYQVDIIVVITKVSRKLWYVEDRVTLG